MGACANEAIIDMTSGELRDQIQKILENGDEIPDRVANRLLLAAHRETHTVVKRLEGAVFEDLTPRVKASEDKHENNKWFQRAVAVVILGDFIARIWPK